MKIHISDKRPYYRLYFMSKKPTMIRGNLYLYDIVCDNEPDKLFVEQELHDKIQNLLPDEGGGWLVAQDGEHGGLDISRGYVNWKYLNSLSEDEKTDMFDDLKHNFKRN
jgi:hypothetical protein